MKVTLVNYNNKSRKGTYIRIKEPNTRARVLKYDDEVPIDLYVEGYKNKVLWRDLKKKVNIWKGGDQEGDKLRKEYLKTIGRKRLSTQIKKGVSTTKVKIEKLGNNSFIRDLYKKILSPLVLDKQLLNIIIDNRQKLKHRFAYKIKVEGISSKSGKEVWFGEFTDIGRRTPEEVFSSYYIKHKYSRNNIISNGQMFETGAELGLLKSMVKQENYGKITNVWVIVQFQRG